MHRRAEAEEMVGGVLLPCVGRLELYHRIDLNHGRGDIRSGETQATTCRDADVPLGARGYCARGGLDPPFDLTRAGTSP